LRALSASEAELASTVKNARSSAVSINVALRQDAAFVNCNPQHMG
jgi:hypothetical protein